MSAKLKILTEGVIPICIKTFLKNAGEYIHDSPNGSFSLSLECDDVALCVCENTYLISGEFIEDEVIEILNKYGIEIRFCAECGKPIDEGFTDDEGWFYSCESCFKKCMDKTYGTNLWKESDEAGEYGGYYLHMSEGEWRDTGVYWTTW